MSEVLRVTHLTRSFGPTTVLEGINLQLNHGDRLAAIGYSGSGKTTLLRLIAGLDVPSAGEVILDGKTASVPGRLLIPPERRGVAMVFQGLALFPQLRALDQIAFAAKGRGGRKRAGELLERIGLGHRASAPLDQLSGGERQRIALARALAQEPKLLLMDEPFASLDDQKRLEMRRLLKSLMEGSDTTLILVTHLRDDVFDLAERVLVLDAGRPVALDFLAGVLENPRHAAAVRCLGLGMLIDGLAEDGFAQTAFGRIPLLRDVPAGRVKVLVRPSQPAIASDGVQVEVMEIELRPPVDAQVQRVAVVRVASEILKVRMEGSPLSIGKLVRVAIRGACVAVE